LGFRASFWDIDKGSRTGNPRSRVTVSTALDAFVTVALPEFSWRQLRSGFTLGISLGDANKKFQAWDAIVWRSAGLVIASSEHSNTDFQKQWWRPSGRKGHSMLRLHLLDALRRADAQGDLARRPEPRRTIRRGSPG
jgi:hypothetical protein